jgi:glycogen synthase
VKIVYLTNQLPPNIWGGMGIVVDFLSKKIAEKHDVSIYTTNNGFLPKFEQIDNIKIYRPVNFIINRLMQRKKSKGYYSLFSNVIKILDLFLNNLYCFALIAKNSKIENYQVIVVHDFMHGITGILCKIFLKLPIVFHVHFIELTMTPSGKKKDPFKIIKTIEKKMADLSGRIIVATNEMKQTMIENKWSGEKIKVVPLCNTNVHLDNFDDSKVDALKNKIYSELHLSPDDQILLFVGRIVYLKGIYSLIHSLKIMLDSNPHIKLIIIGEGEKTKIDSLVTSLDLQNNVICSNTFVDPDSVLAYYSIADICVFPSIQEPFGLVAIEAMTLGKPVILGNGFSSIFEGDKKDVSVVYVDPFNVPELAKTTLKLLSDKERCRRMGEKAKEHVSRNFKCENVIDNMVAVYNETIYETNNERVG